MTAGEGRLREAWEGMRPGLAASPMSLLGEGRQQGSAWRRTLGGLTDQRWRLPSARAVSPRRADTALYKWSWISPHVARSTPTEEATYLQKSAPPPAAVTIAQALTALLVRWRGRKAAGNATARVEERAFMFTGATARRPVTPAHSDAVPQPLPASPVLSVQTLPNSGRGSANATVWNPATSWGAQVVAPAGIPARALLPTRVCTQ